MATDDGFERLNRYLDDLSEQARGVSPAGGADDLDPALAETVRRLNRRDDAPPPDRAFVERLEGELVHSLAGIGHATRLAAVPMTPPALNGRATWAPGRRRRPVGHLATAALLVLTFGSLFLAFGPGRPGFGPSGSPDQRIAILFVVDKSGSMSYDPLGGISKIEMAKEAITLAARSLDEGDQVGVLAFNDQQQWIVPMTTIAGDESRQEIDQAIAALGADGGTEIYPALSVGFDAIRAVDADVRHVVLLSDGKSRTGTRESYQALIDDVRSDRTTLSTIAIGDDADVELLQFLAERGGGRYYFAPTPADIPRLTLDETGNALGRARGRPAPVVVMTPALATPVDERQGVK